MDVHVTGIPPTLGRPPLEIDGTIQVGAVPHAVFVGRPVMGQSDAEGILFRLDPDGQQAVRVNVQFGKSSVNQIEIRNGLQPGDKVILSDMSGYTASERVYLK